MDLFESEYAYDGLSYNIVDSLEIHEKLNNNSAFFQAYMKANLNCLEVAATDDTENCGHISNDTVDSAEHRNQQQWTVRGTKLLLELYKERNEKFRDPKIRKRNLWTEIVKEMDKHGYKHLTEDILDRKLRNLKKTFKTIKDNNRNKSTGRGRITWEYYDIFEEIFFEDRTINFGPTIHSMDSAPAAPQRSPSATPTILSSTPVSTASSSIRLITSPTPSTHLSPARTQPPELARYVSHRSSRISTPVLMRALTNSSDFFASTFPWNSKSGDFEENVINFSDSSSHCSSSSAVAEHVCSESESVSQNSFEHINSTEQKKRVSKETYNLRKQLLAIEKERVQMMAGLKESIDNNNTIQQERNEILKKLIDRM